MRVRLQALGHSIADGFDLSLRQGQWHTAGANQLHYARHLEHLQSLLKRNVHKKVSGKKWQVNLKAAILPFSNAFIEWQEVFH